MIMGMTFLAVYSLSTQDVRRLLRPSILAEASILEVPQARSTDDASINISLTHPRSSLLFVKAGDTSGEK